MLPWLLAFSTPACCVLGFLLIFAIGLTYNGAKQYLFLEKIRNTPTSKVRSAAAGLVELFGKAIQKEKLVSPITKDKCVYWKVIAEYYYQTKNSSGWRKFFNEESTERFYLEDDTGKMLIEPKDAKIEIPYDFSFEGHLKDRTFFGLIPQKQLDKQVLDYLGENTLAKEAFQRMSNRRCRLREYYIAKNDNVYVLGNAEPLEGASSHVAHENLIVKKGNLEKIMYISDSSETKIAGKMNLTAWASLIIGLLLSFIFLVVMLFSLAV
jgi:hypothetical protein